MTASERHLQRHSFYVLNDGFYTIAIITQTSSCYKTASARHFKYYSFYILHDGFYPLFLFYIYVLTDDYPQLSSLFGVTQSYSTKSQKFKS